ncbi:MAG: hypothetical protein GEU98_18515 [Pseudonocardiaceae bacterium]|nr:hypothetical protein [Pseudonocardiaceae bacterium]
MGHAQPVHSAGDARYPDSVRLSGLGRFAMRVLITAVLTVAGWLLIVLASSQASAAASPQDAAGPGDTSTTDSVAEHAAQPWAEGDSPEARGDDAESANGTETTRAHPTVPASKQSATQPTDAAPQPANQQGLLGTLSGTTKQALGGVGKAAVGLVGNTVHAVGDTVRAVSKTAGDTVNTVGDAVLKPVTKLPDIERPSEGWPPLLDDTAELPTGAVQENGTMPAQAGHTPAGTPDAREPEKPARLAPAQIDRSPINRATPIVAAPAAGTTGDDGSSVAGDNSGKPPPVSPAAPVSGSIVHSGHESAGGQRGLLAILPLASVFGGLTLHGTARAAAIGATRRHIGLPAVSPD